MRRSALGLLVLVAGCTTPEFRSGELACAPETAARRCPEGFSCLEGRCWRAGEAPDLSAVAVVDANADAAPIVDGTGVPDELGRPDASSPTDLRPLDLAGCVPLPSDPAVYVKPGAKGGKGTPASPLGSVTEALAQGASRIIVGAGTIPPFAIDRAVEIHGGADDGFRCRIGTTLVKADAGRAPAVQIAGSSTSSSLTQVRLEGLAIEGNTAPASSATAVGDLVALVIAKADVTLADVAIGFVSLTSPAAPSTLAVAIRMFDGRLRLERANVSAAAKTSMSSYALWLCNSSLEVADSTLLSIVADGSNTAVYGEVGCSPGCVKPATAFAASIGVVRSTITARGGGNATALGACGGAGSGHKVVVDDSILRGAANDRHMTRALSSWGPSLHELDVRQSTLLANAIPDTYTPPISAAVACDNACSLSLRSSIVKGPTPLAIPGVAQVRLSADNLYHGSAETCGSPPDAGTSNKDGGVEDRLCVIARQSVSSVSFTQFKLAKDTGSRFADPGLEEDGHLKPTSAAAIDRLAPPCAGTGKDVDGQARPRNGKCDIGGDER